jgi:hypothetical protein
VVGNLFQDVFSSSSGTEFKLERWAKLRGKIVLVYSYLWREDEGEGACRIDLRR